MTSLKSILIGTTYPRNWHHVGREPANADTCIQIQVTISKSTFLWENPRLDS